MTFFGSVSTKHHYGLRLAIQLARGFYKKEPVSLSEVALEECISLKYLEQLIVPFKEAKLVKSLRGRSGGYVMQKDPNKITLREIIWALSDKKYLVSCLEEDGKTCPLDHKCLSKEVWGEVQKSIEETLSGITLGELIKKHEHK